METEENQIVLSCSIILKVVHLCKSEEKIKHRLHSRAKLKTISVSGEVIFSSPHSLNKGYTTTYSDIG